MSNALDQLAHFWTLNLGEKFSPSACALYSFLLNQAATRNTPQFDMTEGQLYVLTGMAINTIRPARVELVARALVEFAPRMGRGNGGSYTVTGLKSSDIADIKPGKSAIKSAIKSSDIADFGAAPGAVLLENQAVRVDVDGLPEPENGQNEGVGVELPPPETPGRSPAGDYLNSKSLNNNNNIYNTPTTPERTHEGEPAREGVGVWLTGGPDHVLLTADTLPTRLRLPNYNRARVGSFAAAHPGAEFADLETLRAAVTGWLKAQGAPTISQPAQVRVAQFHTDLKTYREKNPGKYEDSLYADFFAYWTEPSADGRTVRIQGEKFFDIAKRLSTSYNCVWLPDQQRSAQTKPAHAFQSVPRADQFAKRPVDFNLHRAIENAQATGHTLPSWADPEAA